MMRVALATMLLTVAACTTADAPGCPDGGAACAAACTASFHGNFAELSSAPADCATVTASDDHHVLQLTMPSATQSALLTVSIDLGAGAAPAVYSSATAPTWSAIVARGVGNGGCVYSAGSDSVPVGSFLLDLATIEGEVAHGRLEILAHLQAIDGTDCGGGDVERIDLSF